VKVKGWFLKRETLSGPLERAELGSGPERRVGWCEIETLHGGGGLGATQLDSAVQKQTTGHTFGGEMVVEEETTVVIGNLEGRLRYFYKFGINAGHHAEMMVCLMRALYRIRRFGEHP